MEIEYKNKEIKLDRVISVIDEFVLDFLRILHELNIKYVIISGYVVLLFGRQRITEDVDIFLEDLDDDKLKNLFDMVQNDWWIINAPSLNTFKMLYKEGSAWCIAKKDSIAPNMEVKKPKSELDLFSLNNYIKVLLNKKHEVNISPLELQIAYKLFLGSNKDLEDARWLYNIFKDKLDMGKVAYFARKLNVSNKINLLGGFNG